MKKRRALFLNPGALANPKTGNGPSNVQRQTENVSGRSGDGPLMPSNGSNDFILFLLIHFWLFGCNEVTSRSAARSSYHPTSGLAS
jgi:hypothetical protein